MPQGERHNARAEQLKRRAGDRLDIDFRHTPSPHRPRFKRVIKGPADPPLHPLDAQRRNRLSLGKTERADIVETIHMIDMIMCVENCIDPADLLPQQLRPQVGSGVDQERAGGQADQHAGAGAGVAWIAAGAGTAAASHHRHSHTGAGAEEDQLPGDVAPRGRGGERLGREKRGHRCVVPEQLAVQLAGFSVPRSGRRASSRDRRSATRSGRAACRLCRCARSVCRLYSPPARSA